MLTKDLLKYKIRSGVARPVFIEPDAPNIRAATRTLGRIFAASEGRTLGEIEARIADEFDAGEHLQVAMTKLLLRRCEFRSDDEGTFAQRRWDYLQKAQTMRSENAFAQIEQFQQAFTQDLPSPYNFKNPDLYGDLDQYQPLVSFKSCGEDFLAHRYNCAQIQGLLLKAEEVTIVIKEADLAQRRAFFRALKFMGLLAEIQQDPKKPNHLVLSLSGPLKIFQNAQSYGMKLANFFPFVLLLPKWELRASVSLKKRLVILKLSDEDGIKSHYKERNSFIPPEFSEYLASFNKNSPIWQMAISEELVNIGRQSYCFPDFCLTKPDRPLQYLELFHRWHFGQLKGRVDALALTPCPNLALGIHKNLRKRAEFQEIFAKAAKLGIKTVDFTEFPSTKGILALLESV